MFPAIRLKLLKIGARITCSMRRIVLHLASGYSQNADTTPPEAYRRIAASVAPDDIGGALCRNCQWRDHGYCQQGLAKLRDTGALPLGASACQRMV